MENDIYDFFEDGESEIVKRVKRERINRGRNYLDYLTPIQRAKFKKRNQTSIIWD
jgi:hypothetical protein